MLLEYRRNCPSYNLYIPQGMLAALGTQCMYYTRLSPTFCAAPLTREHAPPAWHQTQLELTASVGEILQAMEPWKNFKRRCDALVDLHLFAGACDRQVFISSCALALPRRFSCISILTFVLLCPSLCRPFALKKKKKLCLTLAFKPCVS